MFCEKCFYIKIIRFEIQHLELFILDPLPEAEVVLQKEAGPDPDLKEKTGMEINLITKT